MLFLPPDGQFSEIFWGRFVRFRLLAVIVCDADAGLQWICTMENECNDGAVIRQ
jgi:hypothetical protein